MNRGLDGIYLRIERNGKWQNVCLSDMTEKELEENLKYWTLGELIIAVIHLATRLKTIGEQLDLRRELGDMIYKPTGQPSYTPYDVGDVVLRHNPNTDTEKLYCIIKANSQTGMYRGITADATCDTFQNDEVVKYAGHTKLIAEVLEQLRFTEGI